MNAKRVSYLAQAVQSMAYIISLTTLNIWISPQRVLKRVVVLVKLALERKTSTLQFKRPRNLRDMCTIDGRITIPRNLDRHLEDSNIDSHNWTIHLTTNRLHPWLDRRKRWQQFLHSTKFLLRH